MNVHKWWINYLKWPIFLRISMIVIFIVMFFGFMISLIEPNEFPTLFEGIWWAVVTISTVGYGDFTPKTFSGRLLGLVLIFIGASFITAFFASLSTATIQKQNERINGNQSYTGSQHIIIVGWNEKTNELVKMIRYHRPFHTIVLIDASLEKAPFIEEKIYFIKGNPTDDSSLQRANIKKAQAVFITSDQHKDERHADMQTISILLAVKGLNPSIYTVCEILTETQTNNAYRAGANELIKSYKLTSQVMMSSFLSKNSFAQIFTELCPANGTFLTTEEVSEEEIGQTFEVIHHQLFQDQKILFGVKKGEELMLNPPPHYVIGKDDALLVLKG